ncbi:unnamed protein product [Paramecium pentaurelia]|uniref:Uncharacterized protein n=1 Tax=Paramecium pentaurelia TaxID=43138 RepID=A0A8S1UX04_9CILI|nr:unnamed protein product [Paramecium pentaurelia]
MINSTLIQECKRKRKNQRGQQSSINVKYDRAQNFEIKKKEILLLEQEIQFEFISRTIPDSTRDPIYQMIMEEQRDQDRSVMQKRKKHYVLIILKIIHNYQNQQRGKKLKITSKNNQQYNYKSFEKLRAKSLNNFAFYLKKLPQQFLDKLTYIRNLVKFKGKIQNYQNKQQNLQYFLEWQFIKKS